MFEKIDVNGENEHPLYTYLKYHSRMRGKKIKWNFGKFLIDRNGNIYQYYGLLTPPLDLDEDIKKLL